MYLQNSCNTFEIYLNIHTYIDIYIFAEIFHWWWSQLPNTSLVEVILSGCSTYDFPLWDTSSSWFSSSLSLSFLLSSLHRLLITHILNSLFFRAHCNWSSPSSLYMVPFSIFLRLRTLKSVFLMQTLSTEFQIQISSDWQNVPGCPVSSWNSVSQIEWIILLPKQVSHCFLYLND